MPLTLSETKNLVIDTVRIVSFTVQLDPFMVAVNYERGTIDAGDFVAVDRDSVKFSQDDIGQVDSNGALYGTLKSALYTLLQSHIGSGQVT